MRTRIMSIVNRDHYAVSNWTDSEIVKQTFPWETLAVQWAYTRMSLNYDGVPIYEAILAERWLLACYSDSYGELPPWNQKG